MTQPHSTQSRIPALAVAVALLGGASLLAHGGQYRGPASVTPPSTSGSSAGTATSTTSGSSGSAGTGTTGSTTTGSSGGGSQPANAPGPIAAAGARNAASLGAPLDDDLTRWQYWWEFGKDPFLRLKEALLVTQAGSDESFLGAAPRGLARDVHKPNAVDIGDRIVPALVQALLDVDNRDMVSGCMVALAKIGMEPKNNSLRQLLAQQLQSHDQEIRETAALCLGIAGRVDPETIALLLDLAADNQAGRAASARAMVDERMRAFAVYGLGLLGRSHELDHKTRQRLHRALAALLAPGEPTRRNLQVAAIEAMSLLWPGTGRDGRELTMAMLQTLADYYARPLGPGAQLIQAHCPTAIARISPRGAPDAPRFKELFARQLGGEARGRSNVHMAQSCALALGVLAQPVERAEDDDARIADLLLQTWRQHPDAQTRNFAILALGNLGGSHVRNLLLKELDHAGRALELPWVAMALGSLANHRYQQAQQEGRSYEVDRAVGARLLTILDEVKNPDAQAAVAIALGLGRHVEASDKLRRLLLQNEAGDSCAGYLCIGLSLMDDRRAVPDIRAVANRFVRRPDLLRQAATALGRLGDKDVANDLAALLRDDNSNLTRIAAIAGALGQIGDRRSIDPLLGVLRDDKLPMLSRAFAAAALGGIGDKDPLPWNAALAGGLNYRAAVETLTDGAAGVLDIL